MQGVEPARITHEMTSKMKCYFLFLAYILPIINNVSKELQSKSSRLPYLYSSLKSNFLLILSNFVKKELIGINIDYKNENNQLHILNIFIGTKSEIYSKSNLSFSELIEVKSHILNFYVELLDQIKSRFDFEREEIKLLNIITPEKILSSEDLPILPLIQQFSDLVDCDADIIVTQWNLLRLSETKISLDLNINSFWKTIPSIKNGLNENCFAELSNFIFKLLSLPYSSAAAERKFSSLTLIKSKLRNKLELNTINSIMLCKELVNNNIPHYVWSAKRDMKN